jgi:MFS transporter, YNFM family, putative membrane transport protein
LTWVAEALPAQRRTLGLGVVVTAFQASAITGQLYGQVVGEAIGWRWVYLLLAVLFVLVTVVLVRRLYEPRQGAPRRTDGLALVRSILRLLGVRVLLAAWLLGALLLAAIFGVYGGMQIHLPAGVGQDGELLVWIRGVGLLGVLAVPVVLWKLGGRPMGLIVAGVVVCVLGLLAQTRTEGMVALGVASVAVAGGGTLAITLLTVLIGQFAPAARATALAIQAFTLSWGQRRFVAVGPSQLAGAVQPDRRGRCRWCVPGRGGGPYPAARRLGAGGPAVTTNAAPLPTGCPGARPNGGLAPWPSVINATELTWPPA